ncbi:MAG: FtsX-like permease family protein [Acidobacteriota bacterium]
MTAPWKKAVADFWHERTRTVLVVLAMALGISAFTTVLATRAILTRELDRGYLATNPASATLRLDAVDDDLVRAVLSGHGVSEAEARRVVSGRLRTPSGEWRGLRLFVVKDYASIRVSRLTREKGAWPPGKGEMLIERDAFQVARAKIGDRVTIRTARGPETELRVTGSVHDVGQAQARMENLVYGYITLDSLAELGEEPFLDQLQISVAKDRFDEAHVRAVAADVVKLAAGAGHAVKRVDVPTPGKHPHSDIMGVLLLAMAAFGLGVLALSGILVINLMTALMGAQIRQIGVMKTVGGTRAQIARIYFSQALFLGLGALVLAVPAGIAGSRMFCRSQSLLLNFDIESFAIPFWVFLLAAAVGILLPLSAAAWPVWKGSGVSIREALSDFGVSSRNFGETRFDRMISGAGGLTRPLLLAIRNSFRRRARLLLTVLTLGAGGLFFMSALNVRASMIHTLDRLFAARHFDLSVTLGALAPFEKVQRAVSKTVGIRQVEGWIVTEGTLPEVKGRAQRAASEPSTSSGGHGAGGHGPGLAGDRFAVLALPAPTPLLQFDVLEGRALRADDTNAVLINTALAAKGGTAVGKEVSLQLGHRPMPWRVVGVVREPFSPPVAYVRRGYLEELGGFSGMTNSLRLALDRTDPTSIARVKASLEQNLDREGVRSVGSLSNADGRFGFDQHMVMIYVALIVMSAAIGAVGALGLMTTMSLNVLERRREMGVLRAIGATPAAVWMLVVGEGCAVGLISWAASTFLAWPVSRGIGNLLVAFAFKSRLDFSFAPLGPAVWLAVSLLLGAVASFLPAWQGSRASVRESLEYE